MTGEDAIGRAVIVFSLLFFAAALCLVGGLGWLAWWAL